MIRRLCAAFGLALVVVATVLLATGSVASAHAVVVSSSPSDGAVVETAPLEVQIQFSEAVSADLGGLTVLDSDGRRVDNNDSRVSGGDLLQASVQPGLADGTYVMNYRVVSIDGHPITGSIVFGVGEGTTINADSVSGLRAGGETGYEIAAGVARFVTYLAALLAAGLAVFTAFVHDQRPDLGRLATVVRTSAVVAGLGAVAVVALQAALVSGEGVGAMTDASMLRQALTEGLDWQMVVLLLGLAVVHLSADMDRLVTRQALAFYGALAVVGSFSFWGHASSSEPRWLAIGSDVVHTAAAAVWFGGLVGLAMVLSGRRSSSGETGAVEPEPEPEPELVGVGGAGGAPTPAPVTARPEAASLAVSTARIVGRFSDVAAATVVALVMAGVAMSWIEVGSIDALTTTTYGRVLLTKVGVVLVVLAAAAYNRFRLVPDIERQAGEDGAEPAALWSRLRTTAWAEAGAVVVVIALTAALVNITPAKTSVDTGGVFNQTQPVGDARVNLVVSPGKVGSNTLHIQYTEPNGRPVDVAQQLKIELSQPEAGVEPRVLEVPKAATGHYIVNDAPFAVAGTWQVTLVARVSSFEEARTTFTPVIGS